MLVAFADLLNHADGPWEERAPPASRPLPCALPAPLSPALAASVAARPGGRGCCGTGAGTGAGTGTGTGAGTAFGKAAAKTRRRARPPATRCLRLAAWTGLTPDSRPTATIRVLQSGGSTVVKLRALADLKAGQELTFGYETAPSRAGLLASFGFTGRAPTTSIVARPARRASTCRAPPSFSRVRSRAWRRVVTPRPHLGRLFRGVPYPPPPPPCGRSSRPMICRAITRPRGSLSTAACSYLESNSASATTASSQAQRCGRPCAVSASPCTRPARGHALLGAG